MSVAQLCSTLCDLRDCILPGSSVRGIFWLEPSNNCRCFKGIHRAELPSGRDSKEQTAAWRPGSALAIAVERPGLASSQRVAKVHPSHHRAPRNRSSTLGEVNPLPDLGDHPDHGLSVPRRGCRWETTHPLHPWKEAFVGSL